MNGNPLRDWDPDPVLIWDGRASIGSPGSTVSYTLAVSVRRITWPTSEAGASVNFSRVF